MGGIVLYSLHGAFKTKMGLTAAVLLSLACPLTTLAAEKTYDNISRWGATEATEGDPITVNELNGWSDKKNNSPVHLTVGTKDTKNVTIHNYGGDGNSTTEVHGQNISIDTAYNGFYLSKGQLTVGDKDDTKDVTINNYNVVDGGKTEVHGQNISFTTNRFWLSKGEHTIGDENTKKISFKKLHGADDVKITVKGGNETLDLGEVSLGQSTVRVGGADTGKVTADSIGVWGQYLCQE